MATYTEIFNLRSNSVLKNKITVAIAVKAQALIDGATPTAAEITWATDAITNPENKANQLMNYVLAKNSGLTLEQINGASDSVIQGQVNTAVDKLITGGT